MKTAVWKQYLQQRCIRFIATLHNGLALIGMIAILFVVLQGDRLSSEPATGSSGPLASAHSEGITQFGASEEPENPKYRPLANYLARKYKVAHGVTEQLVGAAFDAGRQVGLDPLLILAVVAIESRFNPIAESVMGAKGLMQVMPKLHREKLLEHGGEEAVLDPATNILVGARILKEYIRRTGSLESGLQLYAGALEDASSQYSEKVMAEKERLRQAMQRSERPLPKGPQA